MTKIAIVGTGMLIHEIMPMLTAMEEICVAAICGTKRSEAIMQELVEQFQIPKSYTDYDELIEDIKSGACDAEAIYIATPNNTHYEMGKKCLENGINLFMEKPFVKNYSECKELFDLANEKGLIALEAISNQYNPAYIKVKESLPLIGDVKLVECNYSQYSSRFDRFLEGEYFRVFDPKADGGALMDINVYNIHYVAGLFGEPEKVEYIPNIMRDVDTSGMLILQYPDFKCVCIGAKDCQGPSNTLIQGTRGYLRQQAPANALNSELEYFSVSDRSTKILHGETTEHRMEWEFKAFDKIVKEKNLEECIERQKESLIVYKIIEAAR